MPKTWKIITWFALFGLVVAAASYTYAAFYDYTKPMNGFRLALWIASVILCPPQLLFAACIDCEVIGTGGLIMYWIVGGLNAALYAAIGAIVAAIGPKLYVGEDSRALIRNKSNRCCPST